MFVDLWNSVNLSEMNDIDPSAIRILQKRIIEMKYH